MEAIKASSVKIVLECTKYFKVWKVENGGKKINGEIKFEILNQC